MQGQPEEELVMLKWNSIYSEQSHLKTTSSAFLVFENHVFIENDFQFVQLLIRDIVTDTILPPKCKENDVTWTYFLSPATKVCVV